MAAINSPAREYGLVPVLTATFIGFDPGNPYRVMLVKLKRPEDASRPFVLVGGIFEAGKGKHRSQRDAGPRELREEAGREIRIVGGDAPVHFAISQRLEADGRYWCSLPTMMGAVDYIMAAPVEGEISPEDVDEVEKAFWADVRSFDMNTVGRGHEFLLAVWKVVCDCGGLTPAIFQEPNRSRIQAVSNDRWVVAFNGFNHMIYLEDREPVKDDRQPLPSA